MLRLLDVCTGGAAVAAVAARMAAMKAAASALLRT
jgi:hypothetical protein